MSAFKFNRLKEQQGLTAPNQNWQFSGSLLFSFSNVAILINSF